MQKIETPFSSSHQDPTLGIQSIVARPHVWEKYWYFGVLSCGKVIQESSIVVGDDSLVSLWIHSDSPHVGSNEGLFGWAHERPSTVFDVEEPDVW